MHCEEVTGIVLAPPTLDQSRDFGAAFDTTERTSTPDTASDKLEADEKIRWLNRRRTQTSLRASRNLLARGSNANNSGDTPSLVTGFESSAHHLNLTKGSGQAFGFASI